ncbi:4-phosphoerythronate dehydrogenase [Alteromonas sp. D210916BOD_24]|uniref:4-phosphoerythronate dehydrogenase n=1 Tax=Alteromonas sp. D210916BOD_24 TaxID=3157618 RepID=UPI00399C5944
MKILLEDTIPFGKEYLGDLGQVTSYAWQTLKPEMLAGIDILAVRSTTKVTPELLKSANTLQFVTTATAGTNHIDKRFLDSLDIAHNSAAGCNAIAVAEYVVSVLLHGHSEQKIDLTRATVGIVGAGNVGSALSQRLTALGVNHLLCDPPLKDAGDPRDFVSLAEINQCDVISLHVPFVKDGVHPTHNLISDQFLATLTHSQLLINACRGEVVDEKALLNRLMQQDSPTVVLDVFDNEPRINTTLFDHVWLVSPHIAGHSVEGKVRGTQIIYEQICDVMGTSPHRQLSDFLSPVAPIRVTLNFPNNEQLQFDDLLAIFNQVYDISEDDKLTRYVLNGGASSVTLSDEEVAKQFASLRKKYRVRHECSAYTLQLTQQTSLPIQAQLKALGFDVLSV